MSGPFTDIPIVLDETLPPDFIKLVQANGTAVVFLLDHDGETATPVAQWPELPERTRAFPV